MPEWFQKFFFSEVSVRSALIALFASSAFLFLPEYIPALKRAEDWAPGVYVVVFVFSLSVLLANAVASSWSFGKKRFDWFFTQRKLKASLRELSSDEKAFLRKFFSPKEKAAVTANYSDGLVSQLENKVIIFRPSNMSRSLTNFDYNLQPWAREELRKHPELLHDQ